MGKYILVYEILIHYDEGGGVVMERFEKEDEMHTRANVLLDNHGKDIKVLTAGKLGTEFIYKPVSYVVKYEPMEV